MRKQLIILLSIILTVASCKQGKDSRSSDEGNVVDAEKLIQINKQLVKSDIGRNKNYAISHGWDYSISESGVIYEILVDVEGKAAKSGDPVELSYECSILGGELCYSSDLDGLKKFVIDYSEVESGINDITKILSPGDSARVILAPHHAFGVSGDGKRVPARSCLVYHIKLLKIHAQD